MPCMFYTVCDECLRAGDRRVVARAGRAVCCRCHRPTVVMVVTASGQFDAG